MLSFPSISIVASSLTHVPEFSVALSKTQSTHSFGSFPNVPLDRLLSRTPTVTRSRIITIIVVRHGPHSTDLRSGISIRSAYSETLLSLLYLLSLLSLVRGSLYRVSYVLGRNQTNCPYSRLRVSLVVGTNIEKSSRSTRVVCKTIPLNATGRYMRSSLLLPR